VFALGAQMRPDRGRGAWVNERVFEQHGVGRLVHSEGLKLALRRPQRGDGLAAGETGCRAADSNRPTSRSGAATAAWCPQL